jgi:hypothetical protein
MYSRASSVLAASCKVNGTSPSCKMCRNPALRIGHGLMINIELIHPPLKVVMTTRDAAMIVLHNAA